MKQTQQKREFVRMRAEGLSYNRIAERLHISKETCVRWGRALSSEIDDQKKAELAELYHSYGMAREARIRRLGDTLNKINSALDIMDFSSMDPAKLLDLKLKYMEALKNEYIGPPQQNLEGVDMNAKGIMSAFADLLNRMRGGEVSAEQAKEEAGIIIQLQKAYENIEIKRKIDLLEGVIKIKEGGNC